VARHDHLEEEVVEAADEFWCGAGVTPDAEKKPGGVQEEDPIREELN